MTVQFVYTSPAQFTEDERKAAHARFEFLFEPGTDLYTALCPFKAVFAVNLDLLAKVSAALDGQKVEITLHKSLVALPQG